MIPKSLHTVSVLVAVAKLCPFDCSAAAAVEWAAASLNYGHETDVYQLKAAAVRKLEKAMQS